MVRPEPGAGWKSAALARIADCQPPPWQTTGFPSLHSHDLAWSGAVASRTPKGLGMRPPWEHGRAATQRCSLGDRTGEVIMPTTWWRWCVRAEPILGLGRPVAARRSVGSALANVGAVVVVASIALRTPAAVAQPIWMSDGPFDPSYTQTIAVFQSTNKGASSTSPTVVRARCVTAKRKALISAVKGSLSCSRTALDNGVPPAPECLDKVTLGLQTSFNRAQARAIESGGDCTTLYDADDFDALLSQLVPEIVSTLNPMTSDSSCTSKRLRAIARALTRFLSRYDDPFTPRRDAFRAVLASRFGKISAGGACVAVGSDTVGDRAIDLVRLLELALASGAPPPKQTSDIGTAGGAIVLPGVATVVIPPGSLGATEQVTVEAIPAPVLDPGSWTTVAGLPRQPYEVHVTFASSTPLVPVDVSLEISPAFLDTLSGAGGLTVLVDVTEQSDDEVWSGFRALPSAVTSRLTATSSAQLVQAITSSISPEDFSPTSDGEFQATLMVASVSDTTVAGAVCGARPLAPPLAGTLTVRESYNPCTCKQRHGGTDLLAADGTPVFSSCDGKVVDRRCQLNPKKLNRYNIPSGWGWTVAVRCDDPSGLVVRYAHLQDDSPCQVIKRCSKGTRPRPTCVVNSDCAQGSCVDTGVRPEPSDISLFPPIGFRVAKDDLIALSDSSGGVTGPHLHMECGGDCEKLIPCEGFGKVCDVATGSCTTTPSCPTGTTSCGPPPAQCCDNAFQSCDSSLEICVANTPPGGCAAVSGSGNQSLCRGFGCVFDSITNECLDFDCAALGNVCASYHSPLSCGFFCVEYGPIFTCDPNTHTASCWWQGSQPSGSPCQACGEGGCGPSACPNCSRCSNPEVF